MKPATLNTVVLAQAGTHTERAAPHRILSMDPGLRRDDGQKGEGASLRRDDGLKGEAVSEHFERETS
jgi:hypothetical protein